MEPRMENRVDVLSPLEESSAEVSRDSGIVSQSASSLSMLSEALSNGTVSQSPSFDAAVLRSPSFNSEEPDTDPDHNEEDEILRHTALSYSSYIRDTAGDEILGLEKSLEEMLTRVDEFVGMLDMIRNDTSQIVNENLPQIHRKSEEMRQIYRKIDKLDVFVKMVGANVNVMEEYVTQAEKEQVTLPGTFRKIFRTISVPSFLNTRQRQRSKHDPAKPHCFLTHCLLSPEASRTNVSEETPYNWQLKSLCMRPARHKGSLERNGTRTSQPNPPLIRTTLAQLCAASWISRVVSGCDTAWDRTRVCNNASITAMQCLRPLRHSKPASPRRQQHQELPPVFRTDDYFTPHPGH